MKNEDTKEFRDFVYSRYKDGKYKLPRKKHRYKIEGRLNHPLIIKIQEMYEEMYIMGYIEETCKQFGITEDRIRRLIYSDRNFEQTMVDFDTIIRLSKMFDIPYEEFVAYNAFIEHKRKYNKEKQKEESEMLKQYDVGKKWEDTILKYYKDKGYFTYKIPTLQGGTVFDIFVAKKGACLMIECKHTDSDKLYYTGSGIFKKRDELDNFIKTTGNNIYIYVNSEKTGTWWTTWVQAKPIFEDKGYITLDDCFKCEVSINGET